MLIFTSPVICCIIFCSVAYNVLFESIGEIKYIRI
nr:MAG TPA: hypothetical protein [Bacteriophage sp.]DAX82141.1 MAG TPA: hypothetical protein [Caudoviricetes sp.]